MKKILTAMLCLIITSVAAAQYTGPSANSITVQEALKLPDDAYVTLTGSIQKHLGGDKYEFSDGTGTIRIEIDGKLWYGMSISESDIITITGEIDKDFTKRTVEVDHIVIK